MAVQIQLRRGIASLWTSANPTLAQGEFGYELDTGYFKVGNGINDWNTLSYAKTVSISSATNNIAGGTAGQIPYQTGPDATSFYGPGTPGQLLVSSGTSAPVYTNTSSIHVGIANLATNLIGGAAYGLPYQSTASTTAFLPIGPAGQVLQVNTAGNSLVYGDIDGGTY